MRNADTFVQSGWFWRAWPDDYRETDDFKLKSEARAYVERSGGGIRRMRYRGTCTTESTTDTIQVPQKARS